MNIEKLDEIKERLKKVSSPGVSLRWRGWANCPICDDCPFCGGDQETEVHTFDFDPYAAGIQIFGIGDDLENFEQFFKHVREDILALIEMLGEG